MKKIKRFVIGLVVLLLLLVAAVFLWIDHAAKVGVETGATYALGVNTTLDSMGIGVLSGNVNMADLNVGNPPGFSSPHFLRMGDGRVTVSLGTLMGEKVVLPELVLSGINMNLERKGGKANYKVIVDNLKKFESKDEPPPQEKEGKKFVIKKVAIRDIQVKVDLLPIGGELTSIPVTIEQIELQDVGSDSDKGVLLSELTSVVLKAILTAVVDKAGGVLPADIAGELNAGLAQLRGLGGGTTMQVLGQVKTGVGQATEQIKDIGDKTKALGDDLKDAGKELGKGLGGLLDTGEKKDEGE